MEERGNKKKREEDQYPTTNYPYNNCFLLCHHLLNQYNTHSPNSAITLLRMAFTPFPNSYATFPSSSNLQNSSNHSLAPTILHTSSNSTTQSHSIPLHNPPMSHILHYSAITYYTLLITNHYSYLLTSSKPAEPVLSLNSNLTLT